MKKLMLIFCGAFFMLYTNAQAMRQWKEMICNEEKYTGEDSLIFCHVFDSLNMRYGVIKIFLSDHGEVNHYIPLWLGRKGILILKDYYHLSYCSLWLKEMAHAFQFSRQPIRYNALSLKETSRTLYRTIFQNKKFRVVPYVRMTFADMYKLTYQDKRSFEYEAHQKLEVQLHMYLKYRLHQGLPKK